MEAIKIAEKFWKKEYKTASEMSVDINELIDKQTTFKYRRLADKIKRLQNELKGFRSGAKFQKDKKLFNKAVKQTVRQQITEIIESLQEMKFPNRLDYSLRILFKDKTLAVMATYFFGVMFILSWCFMLAKLIFGG